MKTNRVLWLILVMAVVMAAWRPLSNAQPAVNAPMTTNTTATDPLLLLQQADKLRAEGSYHMAREAYDQVLAAQPAPSTDIIGQATLWRLVCLARIGGPEEAMNEVEQGLERLLLDLPADSRWRAEAAEALGDSRHQRGRWYEADQVKTILGPWLEALKFWGESTHAADAQPRYVALNFKLARFAMQTRGGLFPIPAAESLQRIGILPPPPPEKQPWKADLATWALRNVLRVTKNSKEKTEALLLLGQVKSGQLYQMPEPEQKAVESEAIDYFRQAAAIAPANEFSDDALWELAQLQNQREHFVDAKATLEQFLATYAQGQSQWWDSATNLLQQLVTPQAYFIGERAFAPGSHLHFTLNYRNISQATLRLVRVKPETLVAARLGDEYTTTTPPAAKSAGRALRRRPAPAGDNFFSTPLAGNVVREIKLEGIVNDGSFAPRVKELYLDPLEPAIYQLQIEVPEVKENAPVPFLVMIGQLAVATRDDGLRTTAFVANAETGAPQVGANVWLMYAPNEDPNRWYMQQATTDDNGLAAMERPASSTVKDRSDAYWILAEQNGHAAMFAGWTGQIQPPGADRGRAVLNAWSDRPAYRPNETIYWKALLRYTDGREYRLPTSKSIYAVVTDARGATLWEGDLLVSEYGSFNGKFTPTRAAALGMLNLEVRPNKGTTAIGYAQLARLEEYKLPEYKVAVAPGEGQYKLGSAIPFTIKAEYYFGGPVAGAEVQLVVHRAPFWRSWWPPFPYPWLVEGNFSPMNRGGASMRGFTTMPWMPHAPEQIILTQQLATDARGEARVEVGALAAEEVKTALDSNYWGYQYRVEARVVDASRREIIGSGTIKVASTAFAAYLTPQRYVTLPGDKLKVDLRTLDPNDQGLAAEGEARLFKRAWNPQKKNKPGEPNGGYDDTLVASLHVGTDAEGQGLIEFAPPSTGCYLVAFETRDAFGQPVTGETTVFVAEANTTQVGYRAGGVEIITDKATYNRGDTANVLIVARRPGVAVWFAVEAEAIVSSQVIKLDPTANTRMISIPVTEEFEPNIFFTALGLFDYSAFSDAKRLVVAPTRRFLDVTLAMDRTDYRPGETTQVEVLVKDSEGNPVATELSLGVADAAVWAIQDDLAGDIRRTFWSQTRSLRMPIQASPQHYQIQFWRPNPDKPGEFELVGRDDMDEATRQVKAYGGVGMQDSMARKEAGYVAMNGFAPTAPGAFPAMMSAEADSPRSASEPAPMAPVQVRSDFSATALWLANLVTGADGRATAKLKLPDSLTSWLAVSRAADKQTRVGQVRLEFKTNKQIMVRPQAPRYFVEGDQVTLSAIVNNNSSRSLQTEVSIELAGLRLLDQPTTKTAEAAATDRVTSSPVASTHSRAPMILVDVPAGGQHRVDWLVAADSPGTATVTMTARTPVDSDAARKTYPVFEYGIEKFIAAGATLRSTATQETQQIVLNLPADRAEGRESLRLVLEPTLAKTMVNALPYLAEYPYGCVEQTLSRFVPAVITSRVLQQLGIRRPDLEQKLPDMIAVGLQRLYDFQHDDGSWGWWQTSPSNAWMTAYAVQGLDQARETDVQVDADRLRRGGEFLRRSLVQFEDQPDMAAFILYALSGIADLVPADAMVEKAHEKLWVGRDQLNPYTRALFALACHAYGHVEDAQTLVRNLRNGIEWDKAYGTAHWGRSGVYYRWSEGGVEATAFGLRALLAIEPNSDLIDPVMNWLVRNRKGTRWESTRDTAVVIRALADYVTTRREDRPDWTAEVIVNGTTVGSVTVNPVNMFDLDGTLNIDQSLLKTGENIVQIRRGGKGQLYATAYFAYFTREEKIEPAGNEIFVDRKYYRVTDEPTLAGAYKRVRTLLNEGEQLTSGERIEVELSLEAKNHFEYVMLEDLKAAGLEPTEVQSGYDWISGLSVHRELRDEKTAFFIDRLPQGKHTLKYTLRAEVPGRFSSLPTLGQAMYVPEIRANGSSAVVRIVD